MNIGWLQGIALLLSGAIIAGCTPDRSSQEDTTASRSVAAEQGEVIQKQGRRQQDLNEFQEDCAGCPPMIVIPEGSILIGGQERSAHDDGRTEPAHAVRIPSFAVAQSPITVAQFRAFVENAGYTPHATREGQKGCHVYFSEDQEWVVSQGAIWKADGAPRPDDHPMVCITWQDAVSFTQWLRKQTQKPYRLLSESEWEYAARAGTEAPFLTGDCIASDAANFDGTLPTDGCPESDYLGGSTPVGRYEANAFGLHDVSGNVWEWVADCWNTSYEGAPDDGSARTTGDCQRSMLRGGSWYSKGDDLRLSRRVSNPRGHAMETAGFRVAMDWPVASQQAPEESETTEATEVTEATEEVEPVSDIPAPAEAEDQESDTEQDAKEDVDTVEPPVSEPSEDIADDNEDGSLQSDEDGGESSEPTADTEENDSTARPEESVLGGTSGIAFQSRSRNRFLSRHSGRFDALLDIAPVRQDMPVWCWLAVGEMIFRYYHVPNANPAGNYQCGIAGVYMKNMCYLNCRLCNISAQDARNLNSMITDYPRWAAEVTRLDLDIRTDLRSTPISKDDVHAQIDAGLPVVIGVSPSGYPYHQVSEHVALIVGYHDDDFIVNDPFPFSAPQNPYLQAGARMLQPGQYKISETMLKRRLQWKETIYNIRCTGEHCEGGGARYIRYGRRCDVGPFVCGPNFNQSPLPIGAPCQCPDNRGRRLRGEVVQ